MYAIWYTLCTLSLGSRAHSSKLLNEGTDRQTDTRQFHKLRLRFGSRWRLCAFINLYLLTYSNNFNNNFSNKKSAFYFSDSPFWLSGTMPCYCMTVLRRRRRRSEVSLIFVLFCIAQRNFFHSLENEYQGQNNNNNNVNNFFRTQELFSGFARNYEMGLSHLSASAWRTT